MTNTATTKIRRALFSASNKTGLAEFAQALVDNDVEIIATGGTATLLEGAGISVTKISEITNFPEIMDGRVKTLHPAIHAALLSRQGIDDDTLAEHGFSPIDLVVVNLYPFQNTVAKPDCTFSDAIENIDIGGPTMLRSAAKNHGRVTVVVDPSDYYSVLSEIQSHGGTTAQTRRELATKTFAHTAQYDSAITAYLTQQNTKSTPSSALNTSDNRTIECKHSASLRYGENPHQSANLYTTSDVPNTLATAKQLQGKPLSFNNLMDSDAALNCVRALNANQTGCVIVKHATPCGVALGDSTVDAYHRAFATDPTAAFGGIIALNQTLTAEVATAIVTNQFAEVIIAPSVDSAALAILSQKPNCRVLETGHLDQNVKQETLHSISGGVLIQDADLTLDDQSNFTVVTERQPTETEMQDLLFAWDVVRFVKSNAIVYAKDGQTLGIGTGQTSRVFSAKIAAIKAQEAKLPLSEAVMASDAFFPFTDGVEIAAEAGIKAVIQPGGSKRDPEVIETANRLGIAMIMTGTRHFKH